MPAPPSFALSPFSLLSSYKQWAAAVTEWVRAVVGGGGRGAVWAYL